MNNSLPDVLRDFDMSAALHIVREAAALSLTMRGQYEPDLKADDTLVTEADRQLEKFLREKLTPLAPHFSFLGEEGGLSGDANAPCWVIDPIDGTTNFVRGLPLWCISVGLVHQGRAILGIIAVPPLNEIYWAQQGAGAFMAPLVADLSTQSTPEKSVLQQHSGSVQENETPLRVNDSPILMQEDLVACNTTAERAVQWDAVPCRLRNLGALAYHLVALARGSVCAALSHWYGIYDVAAGICICQEAGCVARYLDGTDWQAEVVRRGGPRPLLVAPPMITETLTQNLVLLTDI